MSSVDLYDYVIVGAGPAGLTLAFLLKKFKVLVIDKNTTIGGCHRTNYKNGLFYEHGPRVYSNNYVNMIDLLGQMNIDFYDHFELNKFQISNIGGKTISSLYLSEIATLVKEYAKMMIGYKNLTPIAETVSNFSLESKDYIDRLCRLSDGAESERYTTWKFMQLFDQHALYSLYKTSKPTQLLFDKWSDYLIEHGVKIATNTEFLDYMQSNGTTRILCKNSEFLCKKLIFAAPPAALPPRVQQNFGFTSKWLKDNTYNKYISITFHWKKKQNIDVWGFPVNDYGIIFLELDKGFDKVPGINTILSVAITKVPALPPAPLADEIFRQLSEKIPLDPYDEAIFNDSDDTAYIGFKSEGINIKGKNDNVYSVGVHNELANYPFTTMESAIVNAKEALLEITGEKHKVLSNYQFSQILIFIIFVFIVVFVFTCATNVNTCARTCACATTYKK